MLHHRITSLIAFAFVATPLVVGLTGCSRRYHRRDADAQVASILAEKDAMETYEMPMGYNVYPDPRSRFADPTNPDCPRLPNPDPQLDDYDLPMLVSGQPSRRSPLDDANAAAAMGSESGLDASTGAALPSQSNLQDSESTQGVDTTAPPTLAPPVENEDRRQPPVDASPVDPSKINRPQPGVSTPSTTGAVLHPSTDGLVRLSTGNPTDAIARRDRQATGLIEQASPIDPDGAKEVGPSGKPVAATVQPMRPYAGDSGNDHSPPHIDAASQTVRPAGFVQLAAQDPANPPPTQTPNKAADRLPLQAPSSDSAQKASEPITDGNGSAPSSDAEDVPQGAAARDPNADADFDAGGLRIVPIPKDSWEGIPDVCLPRMFEFESIRQEYQRTYGQTVPESLTSNAPRLTLQNVMELALINSRVYQTQKEVLYQAALALTAERYEFLLRPTPFGNGTTLNYSSIRSNGTLVNGLSIPTRAAATQTMASAGQFLATFANDVVLTFNGADGFTGDIGNELLFRFDQSIFQRDVVFEQLTQAERDVVYAARDFIRFRRELFRNLTGDYYNLLLAYRDIEIASQDFFSNLRGYLQGQAEYEFRGGLPRVQVDQFEQNALRSRRDLISACNRLETLLDQFKLEMGLPPEMAINLALDELEALTASDEATVARELINRARRELVSLRSRGTGELSALINAASVLMKRNEDIQRMSRDLEPQNGEGDETPSPEVASTAATFQEVKLILSILEAKSQVESLRAELKSDGNGESELLDLQLYSRNVALTDALLQMGATLVEIRQTTTLGDPLKDISGTDQANAQLTDLADRLTTMEDEFASLEAQETLERLQEFLEQARALEKDTDALVAQLSSGIIPEGREDYADLVDETVTNILDMADAAISGSITGLGAIEAELEPTMLTALANRLELKNRRGFVADSRRGVKIRADDLKSILDLQVSQRLDTSRITGLAGTPSFDTSETRVRLALDTPLNRRLQRNNFRTALINYNRTIRDLIGSEDQIKFEIRNDLRNLQLRRDQYEIDVKSAALAYERVVSTRLQLQLATGNVVARDFLEAQQAYTQALSDVAARHIRFILDRVELFFDMEAIRLDELGYWPGLLDEELQPPVDPAFYPNNPNPYGRLAPRLWYSKEMRSTVR